MDCDEDSGIADFGGGIHGVERIEKAPTRFCAGVFPVQVFGTWFMGVSVVQYSRTETEPSRSRSVKRIEKFPPRIFLEGIFVSTLPLRAVEAYVLTK